MNIHLETNFNCYNFLPVFQCKEKPIVGPQCIQQRAVSAQNLH